jgi:hypothetical protein
MVSADGTLDSNILSRGMSLCLTRMVPVVCRLINSGSILLPDTTTKVCFTSRSFFGKTIAIFLGDLSLELVNLI